MVTGYLDWICSGIAKYCEIYRKNIFAESVGWSCPCHVLTLMSKISCNPGRIPLHMQEKCSTLAPLRAWVIYTPPIFQSTVPPQAFFFAIIHANSLHQ